jgi:hypothetical protein
VIVEIQETILLPVAETVVSLWRSGRLKVVPWLEHALHVKNGPEDVCRG